MTLEHIDENLLLASGEIGRATGLPEFYALLISKLNEFATAINSISVSSGGVAWRNLAEEGCAVDDESAAAANSAALDALVDDIIADGGGTIYVPSGVWYFGITAAAAVVKLDGANGAPLEANLVIRGDGPSSVLAWGGNAALGAKDFFQFNHGVSHFTIRDCHITQNRAITNPDGAEQHHLFDLLTAKWDDNHHFNFIDCTFGVVKGDAIRFVGGQAITACHAAYAGNQASASFPGPFTNPTHAQRACVRFNASWDGGDVTLTGTDEAGAALVVTVGAVANATIVTEEYFATITAATKGAVGVNAATASIGYAYENRTLRVTRCMFDGDSFLNADPGYGYRACVSVQRGTKDLIVDGCTMRGSDDQLIDYEPTSNGDLQSHKIINNHFYSDEGLAVTGSGNGARDPNKRYHLGSNTFHGGKLNATDLDGAAITDNKFFITIDTSDPVIGITKLCRDTIIRGNQICVDDALSETYGISVKRNSASNDAPNGLLIEGNILRGPWLTAIEIEDAGANCKIISNHVSHTGAAAATGTGINFNTPSNTDTVSGWMIYGNTVDSAGSGTLEQGIRVSPAGMDVANIVIASNAIEGCSRGVRLEAASGAGSYVNPPVIQGNAASGCTTPISVPNGIVYCIGGNPDGACTLRSNTNDPNTLSALDGIGLGSLYGGANGEMYLKTTAGASGWKLVTHA